MKSLAVILLWDDSQFTSWDSWDCTARDIYINTCYILYIICIIIININCYHHYYELYEIIQYIIIYIYTTYIDIDMY